MSSFNSTADALIDELEKVADGTTIVKMIDYMNNVTLDVIGKVSVRLPYIENLNYFFSICSVKHNRIRYFKSDYAIFRLHSAWTLTAYTMFLVHSLKQ